MVHRQLVNMQRTPKCSSERILGQIILGRSNAAGEQNDICTALCNFDRLLYTAAIVAYNRLKINIYAHRGQLYR
ncbi:hypothetical protein D3C73_1276070 [compost metagenome]